MNQGATTEVFAPPAEQPPCKVIPPVDGLLTKRQLAEYLQVHPRTVTRKVTEGVIPVIRIGSAVRFRLSDVLHALQDQGGTT